VSTTVPTSRALTVHAAARRLNVSEKTLYRAIARGELAAIRVGRAIRIPESALDPKETT
jgi:excisionase family DNA binding protein